MEVDFDKQIDTILRDLAKGNSFAEEQPKTHLDADELSAFAENVLPARARLRATEHLADCSRCRKILANSAFFVNEAESETIHEEVKTIVPIPVVPWYSRLFAFPQLAYTMGAFALLLSGMVGILLWQNSKDASLNVAKADKTSERPTGTGGASSEGDAPVKEVYPSSSNSSANVAAPAANTAANSNVSVSNAPVTVSKDVQPLATPAPAGETNTSSGGDHPPTDKVSSEDSERESKNNKEVATKADTKKDLEDDSPKTTTKNEQPQTEVADNNIARQPQEVTVQNQNRSQTMMPDGPTRNMPSPAPKIARSEVRRDEYENKNSGNSGEVAKKKAEPTLSIGGKTFRSDGGRWVDTDYKGGNTENYKRGTSEYKNLDSGLQNIGNSFKETVIVVWKGKNYKIQ